MSTPSAAGRYRIDRLLGTGGFASVWAYAARVRRYMAGYRPR